MQRRYADSPGVWLIIAASAAVYLIDILTQGALLPLGAKSANIWAGQWYRLFTATFLHGGLLHILFNMYALYLFGQMTERVMGTGRFIALYMLSGALGFLTSLLLAPGTWAVGASASIFGLIGYALHYRLRHLPRVWSPIDRAFAQILGINLLMALLVPNIDHWGHLGGLLGGALVGSMLGMGRAVGPEQELPQRERIAATVVFVIVLFIGLRPLTLAAVSRPIVPPVADGLHRLYDKYFQAYRVETPWVYWRYVDVNHDWQPWTANWRPDPDRPVAMAFVWRWQPGGGSHNNGDRSTYTVTWKQDGQVVHQAVDVVRGVDKDPNLLPLHSRLPIRSGSGLAGQWSITVAMDNTTLTEFKLRVSQRL